jgi:hypothetical protein
MFGFELPRAPALPVADFAFASCFVPADLLVAITVSWRTTRCKVSRRRNVATKVYGRSIARRAQLHNCGKVIRNLSVDIRNDGALASESAV